MISTETGVNKATMVPLQYSSWELELKEPFLVQQSTTIEDVKELWSNSLDSSSSLPIWIFETNLFTRPKCADAKFLRSRGEI